MRSYISAILGSLLLFAPTAFAADVTVNESGQYSLTGLTGTPVLTPNGGEITTSIKVGTDFITIPIAAGATWGVKSTGNKLGGSVSPAEFAVFSKACNDTESTFSVRNNTNDTNTYTVTFTKADTCPQGGTSGGGSGGGGGGGGGSSAAAAPAAPAAPAVPLPPALITKLISAEFLKNLSLGVKGEDVKRLRQVLGLADDSDVFDTVLRDKLVAFQLKYKIILTANEEGAGNLGPKTRVAIAKLFPNKQAVVLVPNPEAKESAQRVALQEQLNKLKAVVALLVAQKKAVVPPAQPTPAAPAVAQPSPVAKVVSPVFNGNFGVGARGADISRLQELLGLDPTGYYGNLTRQAVLDFQLKNGVVKSATDLGAGRLGPGTRTKLQEVFGEQKPAAVAPAPVPAPAPSTISPEKKQELQLQLDSLKAALDRIKQQQQLKAAQDALKELQLKAAQKKP